MARRTPLVWWLAALALLVVVTYAPVAQFEFVNWDDNTYVTENAQVRAGLTRSSIVWALTTAHAPYWHPATWTSHLIDVELFGLDAGGHHVTSAAIHLANTLLLFVLLVNLTGAAGRSAFVAALFAVHPIHVESVAWIAERKDVLSAFFLLATIAMYVAYVRRGGWGRYLGVAVLFALALMSKPMVVTLPLVLLLLDIWPLRRVGFGSGDRGGWGWALAEKVPLLALAAATGVATFIVQVRVGAVAGLDLLTWQERVGNAIVSYAAYLSTTFWPVHLAAFYPPRLLAAWLIATSACVLMLVSAAAIRWRVRAPWLFVGWLWYVVTLLPVIGLVQTGEQSMADRFTYLPIIGIFVIVSWGAVDLVDRWQRGADALRWAAICAVLLCAVLARAQTGHWANSIALWQRVVDVTPPHYRAFENLGAAQRDRGFLEPALQSYREAVRLAPRNPAVYNGLGLVLTRLGRAAEAVEPFSTATRLQPDYPEAQNNLGNALVSLGRLPEAIACYREILRVSPASMDARTNLGNALAASGEIDQAIEEYRLAVAASPDLKEARIGLAGALMKKGRVVEAIEHFREAVRISPEFAEAHNGLGAALAMTGDEEGAAASFAEALRLSPDLVSAHVNVAILLIKQGRIAQATAHLERAAAIDPGYEPARRALSALRRRPAGE
jgi:tetratricopeptide (TPR) repeat protein